MGTYRPVGNNRHMVYNKSFPHKVLHYEVDPETFELKGIRFASEYVNQEIAKIENRGYRLRD